MYDDYELGDFLVIRKSCYSHFGTYHGNGMVFHNHCKNGAEIVTLEEFSNGMGIERLANGVDDVFRYHARVQLLLFQRRPYNVLTNNCEHAATFVRGGKSHSQQIDFIGFLGLIGFGLYALSRS